MDASRRGFLRLSRVLPTSRVFTSGYVNKETILDFFIRSRSRTLSCLSKSNYFHSMISVGKPVAFMKYAKKKRDVVAQAVL